MESQGIESLIELINRIKITNENELEVNEMKELLKEQKYTDVIRILNDLKNENKIILNKVEETKEKSKEKAKEEKPKKEHKEEKEGIYPEKLSNVELEERYIGLLLDNPKAISMYYVVHDDCYFESEDMLNLYKSILFTEGQAYAPQIAKNDFNFSKEGPETYKLKSELKEKAKKEKYDFEKTYVELVKLFEIRKNYLSNPIKEIQQEIVGVLDYELYDNMTIQEVKDAIVQIMATEKFKRSVLNKNMTNFFISGENSLTSGLELPFPILSYVFKGIRKGETMAYAMPLFHLFQY